MTHCNNSSCPNIEKCLNYTTEVKSKNKFRPNDKTGVCVMFLGKHIFTNQ